MSTRHLVCRKLIDLRDLMTQYQDLSFVRQARYYKSRHRNQKYKVADLVRKPNHVHSTARDNVAEKLAPKFSGPFTVVEVISPKVYKLA